MNKLSTHMSETEQILKKARNAFTALYANQETIVKMLKSIGDRENLMFVKKNMRVLMAVNGAMERFTLLSDEDATVDSPTSQLVQDVSEGGNPLDTIAVP